MMDERKRNKIEKSDNKMFDVIFAVLFFNYIIESLLFLPSMRSILIIIQIAINIIGLFYFFRNSKRYSKPLIIKTFTFLGVYTIALGSFSSDLGVTMNFIFKFVTPFFYFLLGYNLLKNYSLYFKFLSKSWLFLLYFILTILLSNIFSIGEQLYAGGLYIGYNGLNGLYIPLFAAIFVIFHFNFFRKRKIKILNLILVCATILIILLLLKRTLILILIIALIFYIINNIKLFNILKMAAILGGFYLIAMFYFKGYFERAFDSRSSRFSSEYDITQEGRFTENEYVYELLKDSPSKLLFGSGEVFNDRKSLAALAVYDTEREAHNSFIRVLWNGGLVGITLFIALYYQQLIIVIKKYRNSKLEKSNHFKKIIYFGIVFITLRFINDFSSGITYLGYNAYSYFLIGGIIRLCLSKTNTRTISWLKHT